jgi:hypothetical protein
VTAGFDERAARALFEGVWEQENWWVDGVELKPPRAVGRVAYVGGTVTLVMRFDSSARENHRYGLGRYEISGDRLRYGYDRMFDYTRSGTESKVTPEAVNGVLRPYRLEMDVERLLCKAESHATSMIFERERMQVIDGGTMLRSYRRVRST